MAEGPEFRVLAPFSLAVGGVPLELGSRKARALVALLALDGPRSREALAERLCNGLGEPGARNNLRKTLHLLRATSLGPSLETAVSRSPAAWAGSTCSDLSGGWPPGSQRASAVPPRAPLSPPLGRAGGPRRPTRRASCRVFLGSVQGRTAERDGGRPHP